MARILHLNECFMFIFVINYWYSIPRDQKKLQKLLSPKVFVGRPTEFTLTATDVQSFLKLKSTFWQSIRNGPPK